MVFVWHKEKVGNTIAGSDTFQIKTGKKKMKFVFQQMRHQEFKTSGQDKKTV